MEFLRFLDLFAQTDNDEKQLDWWWRSPACAEGWPVDAPQTQTNTDASRCLVTCMMIVNPRQPPRDQQPILSAVRLSLFEATL
jgi:hypothetical protein